MNRSGNGIFISAIGRPKVAGHKIMLVSARCDDDIERTKCRQQIEFGYDGSYLLFRSVDGNIRLLVYQHFLRPYRKPQDQVCGYFVQLFGSALWEAHFDQTVMRMANGKPTDRFCNKFDDFQTITSLEDYICTRQSGMTTKRDFGKWRKPADVERAIGILHEECRFGKVVLSSDCLHQTIGQPAFKWHHRSVVAPKYLVRKCVNLIDRQFHEMYLFKAGS